MKKGRLEAFTDAVIAIIMTILVLELPQPKAPTWQAIGLEWRSYIAYFVSFLICAITWNNHHNMFQAVKQVDIKVLWANNFQIFSLSMYPYLTEYVAHYFDKTVPEMMYVFSFILGNIAYLILSWTIVKADNENGKLRHILVIDKQFYLAFGILIIGALLTLIYPPAGMITCALTLIVWIIPNKRVLQLFED